MSAYVVDDKTINKVINWIYFHEDTAPTKTLFPRRRLVDGPDYSALGQAMRALNVQAVMERYPDSYDDLIPDYPFEHEWTRDDGAIAACKALECWLYQCTEGTVPKTALYRELKQYALLLAAAIVRSLPEWESAEWG